jgi:glycosyltransferase involved in cell wall biosynthesis
MVIPSLQAGGMERVLSELASYFSLDNKLEIHIVLYDNLREIFYPVPGKISIHKPEFNFNNKWRLLNTLRTFVYLRKTVKRIRPDSVLSFGEYWNSFVLLALSGLSYPVYISDRCSPVKKFSRFHTILRKVLYPGAAGIIAQSEMAKEIYATQFSSTEIRVIGNPIRNISTGSADQKEKIVLMVGRLIKTKHQDKLIELFMEINAPEWKLVLVGYDHLKQNNFERLQTLINTNNCQDRIILTGKQADVDKFYASSSIFAFTSSSEGFPNAIGEAMSAGLPVVAFNCIAGPSEMVIDNYNGFLVPLFDYNQFRDKLEILMKDKDLRDRFGKNAKETIKQFSISSIGDKFLEFILGKE